MNKIKGVIFDLDGTIADTLPLCIRAFRESIEPLAGRSVTDEEIIATFGPSEEGTIMALAPDHYEKGVASYLRFYEDLHEMCPRLFDGIGKLLEYLQQKDIRIGMVTGKGKHSAEISLKRFNVARYFDWIETGSPQGPRKVEGITAVLEHWKGLPKDQVIYVGDAPSDIEASRKAGIPVVSAAWAGTAEPEKLASLRPDALFHTVADFTAWLKERIQ